MKTYKCWFKIDEEGSMYLYCTQKGFRSNLKNHCVTCVTYVKSRHYLEVLDGLYNMNDEQIKEFVIKELKINGIIKSEDVKEMLNKLSSVKISVKG